MRKDDLIRLRHMLDAAREAMVFAQNQTRGSLDTNRMLTLAIVKSLEILGEAASKVSGETQASIPQITCCQLAEEYRSHPPHAEDGLAGRILFSRGEWKEFPYRSYPCLNPGDNAADFLRDAPCPLVFLVQSYLRRRGTLAGSE